MPIFALPVIVATGPLTSDALSAEVVKFVGSEHLYFYDAISPIVLAESNRPVEGIRGVSLRARHRPVRPVVG